MIPATSNDYTTEIKNAKVLSLNVKDKIGFFGTTPVEKQNVDYDIRSITDLLKNYGLITRPYFNNIQGGPMRGSGNVSNMGTEIALSGDGNTAVIGGQSMWIYVRSNGIWSQQTEEINIGGGLLSFSLSYDGNTLAVGRPGVRNTQIYTRSGTTWSLLTTLTGTGGVGLSAQGCSVSLSSDGTVLAVGGFGDNGSIGATWIFKFDGISWNQVDNKLVGTGNTGGSYQGYSVQLSRDGTTLVVGGPRDNGRIGAVWIFVSNVLGTSWSQQAGPLVGTGYVGSPDQGDSVSISGNGNIVAVGGYRNNNNSGGLWIFSRTGILWTQQSGPLVPNTSVDGTFGASVGHAVAVSSLGNIIAVSGYFDNGGIGAVWFYSFDNNLWTLVDTKLVQYKETSFAEFGYTLSIDDNTTTLAVGTGNNLMWIYTT